MLCKNSILGIFPQQYIYIETTGGETYYPENGQELQDALQEIEADGDMIDDFVIKGHGSGEMIEIGHDGDILIIGIPWSPWSVGPMYTY